MNVLQDTFLNQARKDKIMLTIFLINGVQLKGTVSSFDNFTILISSGHQQKLIFKHAVSTIVPSEDVEFPQDKKAEPSQEDKKKDAG
jgi:host factor-I protein